MEHAIWPIWPTLILRFLSAHLRETARTIEAHYNTIFMCACLCAFKNCLSPAVLRVHIFIHMSVLYIDSSLMFLACLDHFRSDLFSPPGRTIATVAVDVMDAQLPLSRPRQEALRRHHWHRPWGRWRWGRWGRCGAGVESGPGRWKDMWKSRKLVSFIFIHPHSSPFIFIHPKIL